MSKGLKKEDSMALKGIAVLMLVFHHCYRTAAKFEHMTWFSAGCPLLR